MNEGKKFEEDFKKSIPSNILLYRLKDPAQGFGNSTNTRFSLHNECDYFLYKNPNLIPIELKTTDKKSLTFAREKEDGSKQIKLCQINGLKRLNEFDGVCSGFIFNFRKDEITYWLGINNFLEFYNNTEKKSINIDDVVHGGGIKIEQTKIRVRNRYNVIDVIDLILKGGE